MRKLYKILLILTLSSALVSIFAATLRAEPLLINASAQGEPTSQTQEPVPRESGWQPNFDLGVRISMLYSADASRDAFFENDYFTSTGIEVSMAPLPGLLFDEDELRVGLEWSPGYQDNSIFYSENAEYQDDHFFLTLDYGVEFFGFLTPYARLGIGTAFYEVDIAGFESEANWLFSGYGALGIEAAPDWFLSPGIRFELGHTLRQDPEFTLTASQDTPEEEEEMSLEGANIGTLSTNGLLFTTQLFLRY